MKQTKDLEQTKDSPMMEVIEQMKKASEYSEGGS